MLKVIVDDVYGLQKFYTIGTWHILKNILYWNILEWHWTMGQCHFGRTLEALLVSCFGSQPVRPHFVGLVMQQLLYNNFNILWVNTTYIPAISIAFQLVITYCISLWITFYSSFYLFYIEVFGSQDRMMFSNQVLTWRPHCVAGADDGWALWWRIAEVDAGSW